jgi:calcineurin-like phosphoesterase family protein
LIKLIYLYVQAVAARIKRHFRKNNLSWFCSDYHFGHAAIIGYCDRPFRNVKSMDRFLLFQWNCYIGPKDTVYFLGDFALNRQALSTIGPKLNGRKFLVSGNHDKTFLKKESKNKNAAGDINKAVAAGWTVTQKIELGAVRDGEELRIIMTHLPPKHIELTAYDQRFLNERIDHDPKALHLHGHLHGKYTKKGNAIDVGWDSFRRPVTLKEIMNVFQDERQYIASPIEAFNNWRRENEKDKNAS